ncbi:hypothetical protein Q0S99_20165, partial [Stenotrophomonas indicatrix]|uniref:hypothetical protein n=1 Tax=Stenotrophomonas indicatrix TaxID=2045451 RepID=UPI00264DFA73
GGSGADVGGVGVFVGGGGGVWGGGGGGGRGAGGGGPPPPPPPPADASVRKPGTQCAPGFFFTSSHH